MAFIPRQQLDAGIESVRCSPRAPGSVIAIVARPAPGARLLLDDARFDVGDGLVGDCWRERGSRHTPDGGPHPGMQLTIVNARAIALVAGSDDPVAWAPAGDQLYVDLDLAEEHLPVGSQLKVGTALVEVTDVPHRGCAKFRERFGPDAVRFVNSPVGRALRLRGVNTRVVQSGEVDRGDPILPVTPPR